MFIDKKIQYLKAYFHLPNDLWSQYKSNQNPKEDLLWNLLYQEDTKIYKTKQPSIQSIEVAMNATG